MAINTIKFSQMTSGGNIANNNSIPGLLSSTNVLFNVPWTFLPPGTTAQRPIPAPPMYYLLRLNTDLHSYEYYDPISATWVELSGSGTGTINPGMANAVAYYASSGTTLSPITPANNSVLVSNLLGVPSFQTTLPLGLNIPSASITSSTASLTSGQIAATPINPTDIANKAYVDSSFSSGVESITGTTNQVIASSPTGHVTLSLPQDIAIGSSPKFAGLTVPIIYDSNANIILDFLTISSAVNYIVMNNNITGSGPDIKADGSDTNVNLNLFAKGAGSIQLISANPTNPLVITSGTSSLRINNFLFSNTLSTFNYTFPDASGTIALVNSSAETFQGDSGTATPSSGIISFTGASTGLLFNASSSTLTLTGTLSAVNGGTGQSSYALGDTLYSSATNILSKLSGNITSVKQYLSQTGTGAVSAAPSWATIAGGDITGAALTSANDTNVTITLGGTPSTALLRAASLTMGWSGQLSLTRGGTGASLTAVNGGIVYSGPSSLAILGAGVSGQLFQSSGGGTPAWTTNKYPSTSPINTLLYASSANNIISLATANDSVLLTNNVGLPFWLANSSTSNYVLTATVGSPASWQSITAISPQPSFQSFTSGSGTYTTPNPAPLYINVVMVGGGGGGSGSGTSPGVGTAGTASLFGASLLAANGGAASAGTPGTASISIAALGIALSGGYGGSINASASSPGGMGGATALGGAGKGGASGSAGTNASANTGAGGGGAGGAAAVVSGAGGSSGGYVNAYIGPPGATYGFTVGSAGSGGAAGAGGSAGANGAAGVIFVFEHYQ